MIKIGALSFINALPFFNPFIEKRIPFSGLFLFGSPSQINKQLQEGTIDIGLISSATFIQNREQYVLLTNLGIGATSSIKTVTLFSNVEFDKLNGKSIAVTDSASTSVMLLKVLCTHFWHVTPKFVELPPQKDPRTLLESYDAVLVIGDDCLTETIKPALHQYDLAEEWFKYTKKPFVFAVFATRVDAWMDWPDEVREFHQKLITAYDYSTANFSETLESAKEKTGLSIDNLQDYYKRLDYYLDSNHFQGLEQFAALYAKCPKK